MRKGIHIPAGVVRITVAVVAVAVTMIALAEAPEARRYLKLKSM
ncbi:hypothetical protein [Streptomyces cavernae]|nr:hypothetical protein [Streptomyces cavernae]